MQLTLLIQSNPLECDSSLCWLKQGEHDGEILLSYTPYMKPDCTNYPHTKWDDVLLNCTAEGFFFFLKVKIRFKQQYDGPWINQIMLNQNTSSRAVIFSGHFFINCENKPKYIHYSSIAENVFQSTQSMQKETTIC